jgi:hypothetical protein
MVQALHWSLVDLIADIGEPSVVVLDACDRLDRRIAHLERWMLANPCPEPEIDRSVRTLIGACAGLWATTASVARLTPAGIDAGVGHLPRSCASHMGTRVDALERALADARRLSIL